MAALQLVTEIKHWDWTTGQLTSVACCTTHKNKCWDVCHRCAVNVAFITVPLHPSTHLPPPSYLCDQQPPPSPLPARQPCTATGHVSKLRLVHGHCKKVLRAAGDRGRRRGEFRGLWTGSVVRQRDRQQNKRWDFFLSLWWNKRLKKKTNKLQPARFSAVTTLFSAHLGDSFTTTSINSSLKPSNAKM